MKKLILALSVMILGIGFQASAGDPPSVHGMLLFGSNKIYISHLPMFHRPHDYQVIAEVELGAAARATYLAAHKADPHSPLYTLVPERFVLPDVISGAKSFKATVFKGHFERGGEPIAEASEVKITKVVHFRKFQPGAQHPTQLEYLVFGSWGEAYAAHLVTAAPDFDQVLSVSPKNLPQLEELDKSGSFTLQIPKITNHKPLQAPSVIAGKMPTQTESDLVVVLKEIYLEFDDLAH